MGTRSSAGSAFNFDEFGRLLTTGGSGGGGTAPALEYVLLSNASATGSAVEVQGGSYIWSTQGTFSGATLTLQALGPDGSTYMDVAAITAAGAVAVNIGDGTSMRVAVAGGPPSGIYSTLGAF